MYNRYTQTLLGVLLLFCCVSLRAQSATAYVTSTGGAVGNCPSGTTTFTPAQFSNASNWGSGPAQIEPGTIVLLCGTITGAANATVLTFLGSGTSASPITLKFDVGAIIQSPYFGASGAININTWSYVTIDGGTNGIIQATANGTSGSGGCPSGTCSNQQNSQGITGFGDNETVQNLTVADMYVRSGTTDEAPSGLSTNCIEIGTTSVALSNVTINNNVVHDCLTGIEFQYGTSGGSDYTLSNNTIYNVNWAWDLIGYTRGQL